MSKPTYNTYWVCFDDLGDFLSGKVRCGRCGHYNIENPDINFEHPEWYMYGKLVSVTFDSEQKRYCVVTEVKDN